MTSSTSPVRGRRSVSARDRERFLEHLAGGGTVREAAKATGRHHSSFYAIRETDEAFAEAWADAEVTGTERLEGEAIRRAIEGYWEETYDGDGNLIRRVHRHDNTLLVNVLKARRPETWRDNVARVELTGAQGGPLELDAAYKPTTLADVLALAAQLGREIPGYQRVDEIEGEIVEEPAALEPAREENR